MINWRLLKKHFKLLVGTSSAGLLLGIIVALLVTPVYRVSTTLLPLRDGGQIGGLENLVDQSTNSVSSLEDDIGLRDGAMIDERERIKALERDVCELCQANKSMLSHSPLLIR